MPITPDPPIFNVPFEIVVDPVKVLVPENVLVPLPLKIIFPLPDKTPVKELFCALLISKVAPEATAIFPADALFLPQSPFKTNLPAST